MKWGKRIGGIFFIIWIIAIIIMIGFQEKFIFQNTILEPAHEFLFKENFEEVNLTANDGAILNGLHFKQLKPNGIILYFHGNARDISYWGEWAETLSLRYNYDVIVWDYRGYGKSIGERKHSKMLDDGLLFYDYALTQSSKDNIVIFGRSLGGAFASHAAINRNPEKLILESTFTNIKDVINHKYWYLPVARFLKFPFQSDINITKIQSNTSFIHGTNDALIPFEMGKQLYKTSGASKKDFFSIEGYGHNNLRKSEAYFEALDTILK